ncbi:hypothetical protein [Paenibacillus periandrae]|uniref:hypothetical protein n=1 Tax=Paenibacillus periandrae TaxID=1761741 RepID=UPI001F08C165|nr:hypothetical protein [Paenibacillus periandrae]
MNMEAKDRKDIELKQVLELSLGSPIGMLRAFPVRIKEGKKAIAVVYSADFDIDPYAEMFFFPTDNLKLVLFTPEGEILGKRDFGSSVIPGIWFCPVFPFDLDGDGTDEIWFVNNLNMQHQLSLQSSCLERIDGSTGETIGQYPWVYKDTQQPMSTQYRNFIAGGMVNGEPVLVTAQGTYGNMYLQGWNSDMSPRWEFQVGKDDPGARGSHLCPVVDFNQDGVDEIFWGERCIELNTGTELFCADRESYKGHSDIVQPVWDAQAKAWGLYTIRETDPSASPRVIVYDTEGRRVWGKVDHGHMDMGWTARLKDEGGHVAMAIRIGTKTCGPDGRFHQDRDEFTFDASSGQPYELPFSVYRMVPVDLNGDGYHELVRGIPGGDGEVLDRSGRSYGKVGGSVAMASHFLDMPGEQLLCFYPDGMIRIWADANAKDSEQALARYSHPYYISSQRLTAVGYNLCLMSGI